jgi:ABC-type glutathione transport system ATPase component
VVDRQSEIDASKPEGEEISDSAPGEVELRDVTFAYPTRPDVPVFRHFNLHVPAGKVTALVGESGSGKSTIVNLVERFYDVQEGMVLVDGVNVKALSIQSLRAKVRLHCCANVTLFRAHSPSTNASQCIRSICTLQYITLDSFKTFSATYAWLGGHAHTVGCTVPCKLHLGTIAVGGQPMRLKRP